MANRRKSVIVTGGSKGIGFAIAKKFYEQGYHVAILSRNKDEVSKAAESIRKHSTGIIVPYMCDIRDAQQVSTTFRNIYQNFCSIDVLVNNAGVNSRRAMDTSDPKEWFARFPDNFKGWNDEIATNLTGVYICSYVAAGYMLHQGHGTIINISSIKGKEPTSSPGYGASKAGVIKLTRDFAKSLAPHGIRVNCIAPGFIDCGMTSELPEDKKVKYRAMIPAGEFGSVEDIARVAFFLASEDSRYITGATLDVNGGYLMD
ncbi:MAG: SDR family NAD(P)-dependent oxidoreductase [Candidatus Woesearchaeota archaeon]